MINYEHKSFPSVTQEDIERFLRTVEHKLDYPSFYYGNELNSWHKEWTDEKIKGIMVSPVDYGAGINGLGINIMYQQINEMENQICERSYMPDNRLYKYMQDAGLPVMWSYESKRPWWEFDWVGFSLYFELQFLNMVDMMHKSGMPLYTSERVNVPNEREYPVVVMGGIAAYCSEGVAEMYDIGFIGDGEAQIPHFVELMELYKKGEIATKQELFLRCAQEIPGAYVPMFYEFTFDGRFVNEFHTKEEFKGKVPDQVVKAVFDITKREPFYKQLLPQMAENLLGYANIEINRGCHNFCRFCKASACHKPYREHSIPVIIDAIKEAPKYEGCSSITPYSLNYTGYSQKNQLAIDAMKVSTKGFTTSTQRVDTFSKSVAEALAKLGDRGCTFAIENGSQRMRNVINKEISDEQIMFAVKSSIDLGYNQMKIYMISNLPWETPADRREIVRLMKQVRDYCKETGQNIKIRISYTEFTSCPFTALQWADCSDWSDKLDEVYLGLQKLEVVYQKSITGENHYLLQLMNRTDRRFNDIIADAVINYGVIYTSRDIKKGYDLQGLMNDLCIKYTGVDSIEFLKEIPVDKILPWDILSNGIDKEWLKSEYLKAKELGLKGYMDDTSEGLTPSCMKTCNKCGVCFNSEVKKQGGKIATYHLKNQDASEEELVKAIEETDSEQGHSKLLIDFSIAPNVRYIPQTKFKILLKSAFAQGDVQVREKMEILSESIPFDNFSFGKDLAMMRSIGQLDSITPEQIDKINKALNGTLKVNNIVVYRPDELSGIKRLLDYILYRVPMRLDNAEEVVKNLNLNDTTIKVVQRERGQKQGRSEYREQDVHVHFVKAVPAKLDENGKMVGNTVVIYMAVPFDVAPYDLLKGLLGAKNKRTLYKYPIEKVNLIKVPDKPSLFNRPCKCGKLKEVDIMGRPIGKKCLECLIKDREI